MHPGIMAAHLFRPGHDAVRLPRTTTIPKPTSRGVSSKSRVSEIVKTVLTRFIRIKGSASEVGHCSGLDIIPFRKQNMINVKGFFTSTSALGSWSPIGLVTGCQNESTKVS